jgi:biopolymer transport protein ExbD
MLVLIAVAIAVGSQFAPGSPSVGFQVLLLKEGRNATGTDIWGNVQVVHIDHDHSWGLNSQKLSQPELKNALQQSICRRTEKVVLIDADPNTAFSEVAEALDTVQSACPTTVALITPNSKKIGMGRLYLPDLNRPKTLPQSAVPQGLK